MGSARGDQERTLSDSKPSQDHPQSNREFAFDSSGQSTSESPSLKTPSRRSRRDLERAFEEACLQRLEDGATATQAIAHYERITRLGLEVRTARLLMLVVLAIVVIQAAVLIVSPVFFSLNLLIGLLGLLIRRALSGRSTAGRG
jgi:hypothetical protein